MLGCIQPMSSPMMNMMLGFCCCCAMAGGLAIVMAASAASNPRWIFAVMFMVRAPAVPEMGRVSALPSVPDYAESATFRIRPNLITGRLGEFFPRQIHGQLCQIGDGRDIACDAGSSIQSRDECTF